VNLTSPFGADALRDVLRQTELSGAVRRAALLHMDRLPPALSKPHHIRLARDALRSLTAADRAQLFELSRGRLAVVWRSRGDGELTAARDALAHLLADQPGGEAPGLDSLLTLYDLPAQAPWLMDELAESTEPGPPRPKLGQRLDIPLLARLEAGLVRADLSRFVRRREVLRVPASSGRPFASSLDPSASEQNFAWESLSFAVHELAAAVSPNLDIRSDQWLFWRLTRLLDRRLLAILSAPGELAGVRGLGLNLNVGSILSEDFLRLDAALPPALRGRVVLYLQPADILGDPAAFTFAASFARLRRYRLALGGGGAALLKLFDFAACGLHYLHLKLTPEMLASPTLLRDSLPPGIELIVSGLDRHADLRWAIQNGVDFGCGRALSR
jgi:hypothetical protein